MNLITCWMNNNLVSLLGICQDPPQIQVNSEYRTSNLGVSDPLFTSTIMQLKMSVFVHIDAIIQCQYYTGTCPYKPYWCDHPLRSVVIWSKSEHICMNNLSLQLHTRTTIFAQSGATATTCIYFVHQFCAASIQEYQLFKSSVILLSQSLCWCRKEQSTCTIEWLLERQGNITGC